MATKEQLKFIQDKIDNYNKINEKWLSFQNNTREGAENRIKRKEMALQKAIQRSELYLLSLRVKIETEYDEQGKAYIKS